MYAHELQMNPPSDKKITSKQKLVTINMQISCFLNTNGFFSSTNYIARPKQKICQTETLTPGACYAGYSYMYALQMNPLVTIMQILCFVNTHGFFSSTSYIKNPTHSHDLTCLFALFWLTIKWTRINSSTAWQQGKKHFMQTVCSILRNKLTKSFRSFYILNLRLQREHRRIKDETFFVYIITKKEQYFLCTPHASEDSLKYLRKTIFAVLHRYC